MSGKRTSGTDGIRLFVDDIRDPEEEGWHIARTVTEAIRALATMPVIEVSVDHDITHDGKDCKETFEPVVRYLALMPEAIRPRKIRIHTANSVQARKLKNVLADAGISSEANLAR